MSAFGDKADIKNCAADCALKKNLVSTEWMGVATIEN